ncbi:MAG: hypothetical protein K2N78_01860 [Oscillospiraceae bacterium]|nr:hypothetical protein [Oscillospiraceae bacterium]
MDIPAIGTLPAASGFERRPGADARLHSLEQKLRQLTMEREKAVQSRDDAKREKLERQIQAVQRQIEQLRSQNQKQDPAQSAPPNPDGGGKYIDVYA